MDRLMEEKSIINCSNNPTPLAEVNNASPSTPFSDYEDFESRKPICKKTLNALKADNKPHMIALCGMRGVGKTTMMKKLQKVVRENKMFDFIIEVAIGENMNVSIIQKACSREQLTIDLNESTKEARVSKLRNGFEAKSDHGTKKFMVIGSLIRSLIPPYYMTWEDVPSEDKMQILPWVEIIVFGSANTP